MRPHVCIVPLLAILWNPDVSVMETRRCGCRATAYAAVLFCICNVVNLKTRFRLPVRFSAQNAALTSLAPAPPANVWGNCGLTAEPARRTASAQAMPTECAADLGAQQTTIALAYALRGKPARQRINTLTEGAPV